MGLRIHRQVIKDKDQIIHGLHQAIVSLTACMESQRETIETIMNERDFYCQITPRTTA